MNTRTSSTDKHLVEAIVKQKVATIFANNLSFSFIAGSFAVNKATKASDIDIFICLKERNANSETVFLDAYLKLHHDFGYTHDDEYFYEVVDLPSLKKSLELVMSTVPTMKIVDINIYDGIVWAGMLANQKMGFFGDPDVFDTLKKQAEKAVRMWYTHLSTGDAAHIQEIETIVHYLKNNTRYV